MSEVQAAEIRYARDKPKDCRYCYYWGGGRRKCMLGGPENCYYRLPEEDTSSRCYGCPYGRVRPCIGWCTVDVLEAVLGRKKKDPPESGKEAVPVAGDPGSEEQKLHDNEQLSSAG